MIGTGPFRHYHPYKALLKFPTVEVHESLTRAFSAASSGMAPEQWVMGAPKSLLDMASGSSSAVELLEITRVHYSGKSSKMSFHNGSTSAKL